MMNDVAPETPTASRPSQMNTARPTPQRPAWTPRSMLGARRCTRGGCYSLRAGTTRAKKKARGSASTPSGHFAEPVSLLSTASASFRLPPTTARCRFDLLAFRARRRSESRGDQGAPQEAGTRKTRNLRKVQFFTFPQPSLQLAMESRRNGAPAQLGRPVTECTAARGGSLSDLDASVKSDASGGVGRSNGGLRPASNLT
jgi:hypothetical protein